MQRPTEAEMPVLEMNMTRFEETDRLEMFKADLDVDPGSPLWEELALAAQNGVNYQMALDGANYQIAVRAMLVGPHDNNTEIREAQIDKGENLSGVRGIVKIEGLEIAADGE